MDKTFTVAGTSIKKGEKTNRFANGTAAARAKVLQKDNHSEIMLYDLPNPMTKDEAIAWLAANSNATPVDPKAATPKEPKAQVVRTPVVRVGKPTTTSVMPTAEVPTYTPEELATSPVARAVHEAGKMEIQVTAEQETEAMQMHRDSCIDFLPWVQLDTATRNEFRAVVLYCPKAP